MNPKNLNNIDPWMLGEEIPDADLFFSTMWMYSFTNDFIKQTGRAYNKILCKYEGYHLWFYFGEEDSNAVAQNIVEKIIGDDNCAQEINKNILLEASKLRSFSETIPQIDLDKISNEELFKIYKTHNKIHNYYYTWSWIPVAADMFHNNLTTALKDYLLENGVTAEKLNEYFIILTQPTSKSLIFTEQQELLKIAEMVENEKEDGFGEDVLKALEDHRAKYYYTKCIFVNGEYTLDDYKKQLQDILSGEELPSEIIKKQNKDLENNKIEKDGLFKKLNFDKKWENIFREFGEFMVTKIYRRYSQLYALYEMGFVLREIAKRFFLSEEQVRHMLPIEIEKMLLENEYNEKELSERTKMCVYYSEKDFSKVYIGQEAEELLKQIKTKDYSDVAEFKGEVACSGLVKGRVKIVIKAADMYKMEQGDILVSIATDPDIIPAMKRAGAIVTEQGGVTSHAAIVSRELNIPCVIGTKIATKVLKDGDLVEVDANNGIIKIL